MRPHPRRVVISKLASFLLLLLTSLTLLSITLFASGRVYKHLDTEPFRELNILRDRLAEGELEFHIFVALGMPILLNILMFVPWGFLLFVFLDNRERGAVESYLLVLVLGLGFSSMIEAWQYFLPTRVMDINDVIWNVTGALLGAVLGHLQKRVRFDFE
jgi:glycopeptide antibiotics resistance protein